MRIRIFLTVLAAAAAFVVWTVFRPSARPDGNTASVAPSKGEVLHVDDFMRDVDRYPGEVVISGVVSDVVTEGKVFTMIDTSEFEKCGTTDCSLLYLPVQWQGEMPAQREWVTVTGKTKKTDGKLIFVAGELKRNQRPPSETGR